MQTRPGSRESEGKLTRLLSVLASSKKILILPHDNPDPDSLASAAALRFVFQRKLQKVAAIGLGGIVGRSENRALVATLEIPLVPMRQILPGFRGSIVLVDTQPGRNNNSLPDDVAATAVVDHHPDWGQNDGVPFVDLREPYGATSTLVTEYLQEAEIPIDPLIATGLFYGISSETQHLGRETRPPDIVASQFLYPYVQKRLLADIEHPRLSRTHFELMDQAVRKAIVYGDVVVSALESVPYPDAVAEIADFLMRLETARWSVCVAPHKDFLYVSMRTNDLKARAGRLLASLLPSGAAGGHGMIAGGRVKLVRGAHNKISRKVLSDILRALGKDKVRPQSLVPRKKTRRSRGAELS